MTFVQGPHRGYKASGLPHGACILCELRLCGKNSHIECGWTSLSGNPIVLFVGSLSLFSVLFYAFGSLLSTPFFERVNNIAKVENRLEIAIFLRKKYNFVEGGCSVEQLLIMVQDKNSKNEKNSNVHAYGDSSGGI